MLQSADTMNIFHQ